MIHSGHTTGAKQPPAAAGPRRCVGDHRGGRESGPDTRTPRGTSAPPQSTDTSAPPRNLSPHMETPDTGTGTTPSWTTSTTSPRSRRRSATSLAQEWGGLLQCPRQRKGIPVPEGSCHARWLVVPPHSHLSCRASPKGRMGHYDHFGAMAVRQPHADDQHEPHAGRPSST